MANCFKSVDPADLASAQCSASAKIVIVVMTEHDYDVLSQGLAVSSTAKGRREYFWQF